MKCCRDILDVETLGIYKPETQPEHRSRTDVDWMARTLRANMNTNARYIAENALDGVESKLRPRGGYKIPQHSHKPLSMRALKPEMARFDALGLPIDMPKMLNARGNLVTCAYQHIIDTDKDFFKN